MENLHPGVMENVLSWNKSILGSAPALALIADKITSLI